MKVIVPPAAGNQVVADKLGWKLETIQVIRSAFFSFLIIFLKMIGFPGAGFLLSWSPESDDRSVARSPKGGTGSGGGGVKSTEETKDKQPGSDANVVPIRAASDQLEFQRHHFHAHQTPGPPGQQRDQATHEVSTPAPRVPAGVPTRPLPLTLKSESKTLAELLAVQPSWPSQKALADAMGVSQAKLSRDLKKLKGRGKVEAKRNWRSNAITARKGNGSTLHAFG